MTQQPSTSSRLRPFKPMVFGRYTLLMPLSVGGMGEIFLARLEGAQGFEKLCVIKKILPHLAQDPDFVSRFVNEAKTLVKLSHGCVAQVLDMGLNQGEPFLALEYVDGKDLRRVISRVRDRNMPLPVTFVLFVMSRVLDALAYAHRKRDDDEKEIGLVHRDVSPQNILISYEGEVKVIDFGLAKSTLNISKTNPSIILGKFLYMSPEQARHGVVDRRSDLYSVGLCLYELLAGKNPFEDVPPGELMGKVANPQIVPIQRVEPLCPAPIAALVTRALAPDPAQRFQTAEEFRGKLLSALLEIDASAGPESVTRFMRETFAAEYQAERKLLQSLREVARAEAAPQARPADESTGIREQTPAVRNLREAARRGGEPTPAPTDLKKLSEPRVLSAPAPSERTKSTEPQLKPVAGPPRVEASPLSFAPTPRGRPARVESAGERETSPGIIVDSSLRADTQPLRPLMPGTRQPDEPITANASPTVQVSDQSEPTLAAVQSVVVGTLEPEPEPQRRKPLATPMASSKKPEPPRPVMTAAPLVAVSEVRGHAPVVEALPRQLQTQRPDAMADTKTRSKRPSIVWVLLPLFAVLGLVGYVALDLFRAQQNTQEEEQTTTRLGQPSNSDNRTRTHKPEIVVDDPEQAPPAVPDEDLAELHKKPTAPRPVVKAADSKLSQSQRAFNQVNAAYIKLENANESAARPFKGKMQVIRGKSKDVSPDDPNFKAQCEALHDELQAALNKPENQ